PTRTAQSTAGARRSVRSNRRAGSIERWRAWPRRRRSRSGAARLAAPAALALARHAASADRAIAGGPRLQRGLHLSESMRGADLHASLHRSHPRRCAPVVQHGGLGQSREAGRLARPRPPSREIGAPKKFVEARDRRRLEDLASAKEPRRRRIIKTALLRYIRVPCWPRRNRGAPNDIAKVSDSRARVDAVADRFGVVANGG